MKYGEIELESFGGIYTAPEGTPLPTGDLLPAWTIVHAAPLDTPLPAELPVKRSHPFPMTDEILQHGWSASLGTWTLPAWEPSFDELLAEVERDDDPHDHRRRPGEVPRPKTTPPMWANDPARQKRNRKSSRRVK